MCADCIFGVFPHSFDDNVLLNPLEENLNVPPVPVQVCDLQCTDVEVVGNENDFIFSILIIVAYGSYWFWVQRHCIHLRQADGEVTCDAGLLVCFRQAPMADFKVSKY